MKRINFDAFLLSGCVRFPGGSDGGPEGPGSDDQGSDGQDGVEGHSFGEDHPNAAHHQPVVVPLGFFRINVPRFIISCGGIVVVIDAAGLCVVAKVCVQFAGADGVVAERRVIIGPGDG